jgi:plastocyanin
MRARVLLIVSLLMSLGLVVLARAVNQSVTATPSNTFSPADVTVSQGETVTWTNGGGEHNVKFEDGTFEQPAAPSTTAWTVSRTFGQTGSFRYYCEEHGLPGFGMAGTVTVVSPGGTPPPVVAPPPGVIPPPAPPPNGTPAPAPAPTTPAPPPTAAPPTVARAAPSARCVAARRTLRRIASNLTKARAAQRKAKTTTARRAARLRVTRLVTQRRTAARRVSAVCARPAGR